jgi:Cellulose binding domain/Glycosyl hydrolases family 18
MGKRTTSRQDAEATGVAGSRRRARGFRWVAIGGATTVAVLGAGVLLASNASADELSATFAKSSQWTDGYVATYVVKNTGSSTANGWTVQFDLPTGDTVAGLWNGALTAQGSHYTVHNDTWNGTLSPGSSTDFGFQVQGPGANLPGSCTINDQDCGGGTAPSTPVGAPTTTTTTPAGTTTTAPPVTTTTAPTGSTTTAAPPPPASGSFGAFAPYADLSLFPMYDLAAAAKATGGKYFNLAFITDGGGCTPKWGGVTDVADPATSADISALRAAGGDVRVSFGGASGSELALTCTSAQTLAAAYQKVITAVNAKQIDFDVEGAGLANTAANDRRNQAIAILEQNNKSLSVSYTLPVLPSGLTQDGVNLLQSAKTNNAAISAVNIMAMDYGSSFPADMGQNAIDAATAVQATVKSVWGLADAAAWQKIAVTPMIGVNDVSSETYTVADASKLVTFAKSKHLAWLSFWSATRDAQCPGGAQSFASPTCSSITQSANAFAKAFVGYTG